MDISLLRQACVTLGLRGRHKAISTKKATIARQQLLKLIKVRSPPPHLHHPLDRQRLTLRAQGPESAVSSFIQSAPRGIRHWRPAECLQLLAALEVPPAIIAAAARVGVTVAALTDHEALGRGLGIESSILLRRWVSLPGLGWGLSFCYRG
jgi:hypothetical protein